MVSKGATRRQWKEWLRVPLEHAAVQGNHALVDKLLGAGANGSAGWKGCSGRTLLHAAAVGGSEGVVSSLLRAGAQPDVNVLLPPPSSRSPLYQATSSGHEAAARLLVMAGADVNFQDPVRGRTILHAAINGGHEQLAKELILSGADVEARNSFGSTPLLLAASRGLDGTVSVLLLRGVDKDAVNNNGRPALLLASGAAGKGHAAVVETLLAAGVDVNTRCHLHRLSALDWASHRGHLPSMRVILRHGANVNSRQAGGTSALHRAARHDRAAAVNALIEAGADVEIETNEGSTPLGLAAEGGRSEALLALLQKGAFINAQDDAGNTPLSGACRSQRRGLAAVVDLLLIWGADETAKNNEGKTPADMLSQVPDGRSCSQADIDQARLLLARAPADRAWRRRGWLVMLRARASKARIASCDSIGSAPVESSDEAAASRSGEGRKVARTEGPASVESGEGGEAGGGVDNIGAGSGDESGALRGAVGWLVGMKPEAVFRTVLEFV